MKKPLATFAVLLLATTYAFHAGSDEPNGEKELVTHNTSELGEQLIRTLSESLRQRLAEYRLGRTTPAKVIAVNRELYEAQLVAAAADQRSDVAASYLERAKEVESIAERRVSNGTGTSMDVLDAKASRLRATIELSKVTSL
ncbi:MAG: TolC family protein [Planctomycetota bacterium]